MDNKYIIKLKKDIIHRHDNQIFIDIVNKFNKEDIEIILISLLEISKSQFIKRDIDILKMRYAIDYKDIYTIKSIAIKYDMTSANVCYTVRKVIDYIRRFINNRYVKKPLIKNLHKNIKDIYIHRSNINHSSIYFKHLSGINNEKLKDNVDIAAELAGRDLIINELAEMLDNLLTKTNDDLVLNLRSRLKQMKLDIYQMTSEEYNKEAIT